MVDEDSVKTEDDEAMPAPRVKVGPNGEIILDEASTVVETKAAKEAKKNIELSPIVVEKTNRATNYGTWSKKRKHSDWSDRETLKFYRYVARNGPLPLSSINPLPLDFTFSNHYQFSMSVLTLLVLAQTLYKLKSLVRPGPCRWWAPTSR